MRVIPLTLAVSFVAGCATTTPPANVTKVYDHKYGTYSYVAKAPQNEFVGTSAPAADPKPAWFRFQHP